MSSYVKRKEFSYAEFMGLVDEVGDCLEWKGAYRATATPLPLWNSTSVRLIVWRMVNGEVREGLRLTASCKNHKCVHPDHLRERRRAEEIFGITRSNAFKAKIAATKRTQMAIDGMSMGVAREIRNSPESSSEIARRLNMNEMWVGMVRRHKRWAEYVTPFTGLIRQEK